MPTPWSKPPPTDESGRLTPEVLARARRRVRRSLAALVVVVVAAGLLAYGCSRLRSKQCCGGRTSSSAAPGELPPLPGHEPVAVGISDAPPLARD